MLHHPDKVYNLPDTVENLLESAGSLLESSDSLPDSREPQACTGMALPGTWLRLPDSGKPHRSLSADGYQVLETAVRGLQVVD